MLTSKGITAREAARQRKQLERELAQELRRKDRERLRELRDRIRTAKLERRNRLREVTEWCRALRVQVREEARRRRRELALELQREREQTRATCSSRRTDARAQGAREVEAARAAYQTERSDQRFLRRHERDARVRQRVRSSGLEQYRESDDDVRANIAPELVPLWNKVKGKIRESPRRTRLEAFLEYVHDHPAEVYHAMDADAAEHLERLEEEERRLDRESKKGSRYARGARELERELARHERAGRSF